MVSIYTQPLVSSEIKKVTKTKLIKVYRNEESQNERPAGYENDRRMMWEPESEPF